MIIYTLSFLCAYKLKDMISLDNNNYDTTKKPTVFIS